MSRAAPETACALIGDIGATHARFALKRAGRARPEDVSIVNTSDFETLEEAIRCYLEEAASSNVSCASLAVAAPVQGARVQMTNHSWQFDIDEMQQHFGWQTFRVINDFTAMALGVLHVNARHCLPVCGGPGDDRRPKLVMGPGTGLGVSALVPVKDGWAALETQGGHVDFAPADELEMAILRILRVRFGRVSVERILCGQGLLNLYQAHAELQQTQAPLNSPEAISAAALNQRDGLAVQVLRHFCEILGRVAGNAALTFGSTGGVYLCGGILPVMADFLSESGFRNAFEDKGRMRPLMELTPVFLVTDPCTGLLGAAEALNNSQSLATSPSVVKASSSG